ncbi:hypothetical protein Dimus_004608 [Dionaea muscipula]
MEKDQHQKEVLQLLPSPPPSSSAAAYPWFPAKPPPPTKQFKAAPPAPAPFDEGPSSLDLQLSISFEPIAGSSNNIMSHIRALKWQAAEQIRLAAMERAYAERVRELSCREMELAHAEFARARAMWERALDELANADKLINDNNIIAIAKNKMDSSSSTANSASCLEITCHSCRQTFTPSTV